MSRRDDDDDDDTFDRGRGRPRGARDDRDILDLREGRGRPRRRSREDDDNPWIDDREPRRRDTRGSRDRDEDERDRRRDDQDEGRERGERDEGKAETPAKDQGKDDKGQGKGDKEQGKGDKDAAKAEETRSRRRPIVLAIVGVVVLLAIAAGLYYYLSTRGKVSTDDAYTDGNVVAIAPQVSGQVISLDVNDNQFVHKGDPLVHIDPRQFQYSREQAQGVLDANKAQVASQQLGVEIAKKNFPANLRLAQADLDAAKANLLLQQANYNRQKSLPRAATTQQEVDSATASLQQAQAQVEQAGARVAQAEPVPQNIGQSQQQVSQLQAQAEQAQGQLDQANLNVEWAVVRAPQDGWVTRRNVNAGTYVTAGTQIMSIVTTDVWVTANFKETELDGMRPGQQVTVKVDAYPDLDLRGHVDSIQLGSGSKFSAFPAENATGNFIKIVQRVPVKIVIDSGMRKDAPLPLGVSVEPTVVLK